MVSFRSYLIGGDFSEDDTFSVTDCFAHTPRDVLSANFGGPQSVFAQIVPEEKYAFEGVAPGPLVLMSQIASCGNSGWIKGILIERGTTKLSVGTSQR